MKPVVDWMKSNVFTLVFLVIMVAGLVVLPLLASSMNDGIRQEVKSRAARLKKLESFEKTQVQIGSAVRGTLKTDTIVVNPAFIQRFEALTTAEFEDAKAVFAAAEAHNSKGRGVLLDALFPDPPYTQREVLPKTFHERFIAAHEALLDEVRAGSPPGLDEMSTVLQRSRQRFLTSQLQKGEGDALTAEEQEQLDNYLSDARRNRYRDQAESISFYASIEDLRLPAWDQSRLPSMTELFDWQWQYWINQDLLHALAAANAESSSVRRAPVKRVVALYTYALPEGAGAAPQPANAAAEIRPDYGTSFTGRRSNGLYDVRFVQMDLVVETARLPQVIDAIARENFYTITNMTVTPANAYTAARDGFLYGSEPCLNVSIELESVWLRSWTTPFMPEEVRVALGVPSAKAAGASDGGAGG